MPFLWGLCFSPHFQNLERNGTQHKAEVEHIMEQLKELKQKAERDKEALKKAIRAQKERAERSEEYAEQLNIQLAEKVVGYEEEGKNPSLRVCGGMCKGKLLTSDTSPRVRGFFYLTSFMFVPWPQSICTML